MEEEFEPWKIVRTCAYFYSHKPAFGKQPAIYKNCLAYIAELLVYIRKNIPNEAFFQTAGVHARQKHDEFEKNS